MTDDGLPILALETASDEQRLKDARRHFVSLRDKIVELQGINSVLGGFLGCVEQAGVGNIYTKAGHLDRLVVQARGISKQMNAPKHEKVNYFRGRSMLLWGMEDHVTPCAMSIEVQFSPDGDGVHAVAAHAASVATHVLPDERQFVALSLLNEHGKAIYLGLNLDGLTALIETLREAREEVFDHNDWF